MAQEQEHQPGQEVVLPDAEINGKPNLIKALDKRDISPETWRVLMETIWPGALSPNSVMMAIDYCKARNLDPLKRPVHIVPMWSKRHGKMVETIWPGISEVRTTAARTGHYVGCLPPEYGPMVEREFVSTDKQGKITERKTVQFPEWCRRTVRRRQAGVIAEYTAEVYWLEAYATKDRFSEIPNEMWARRARGQLDKCTEAAALRMAFPEELGSDYTAEEMEGRILFDTHEIDPPKAKEVPVVPSAPSAPVAAIASQPVKEANADNLGTVEEGPAGGSDPELSDEDLEAAADYMTVALGKIDKFTNKKALVAWWATTFVPDAERLHLSETAIGIAHERKDEKLKTFE